MLKFALFFVSQIVAFIRVVSSVDVDPYGYVVYCPCMGMLFLIQIFKNLK